MGHERCDGELYEADTPQYDEAAMCKVVNPIANVPGHERVDRNLNADVGARTRLAQPRRDRALSRVHWEHPVIIAAGKTQ